MADLDDIQHTLHEIRDLMKQDMEATAKRGEEARRNTESALGKLTTQATILRFERIFVPAILVIFVLLYWFVKTQIES